MNNAQKSLLFLAGGLAAGFALATFMQPDGEDWLSPAGPSLEERIGELERRLASESAARIALVDEIDALRGLLEADAAEAARPADELALLRRRTSGADVSPDGEASADSRAGEAAGRDEDAGADEFRERRRRPTPEELEQRRIQRFVDAGFTVARAEWIEQRSAELQMQQLEAQYEAARSGDPSRARRVPSVEDALRAELGDAEYERYLEATGRPTRIGVRSVLPSSPAAQVGLQPGDEIVSYGGQRVFDLDDLNRLTLEGQPGESVVLEVVRDGQPLQLYVPRGPMGISGGGRRFP